MHAGAAGGAAAGPAAHGQQSGGVPADLDILYVRPGGVPHLDRIHRRLHSEKDAGGPGDGETVRRPALPGAAPSARPAAESSVSLLSQVEDYIPRCGCHSYFALCTYAHTAHPEWMETIRANAQHLDLYIRSFTAAEEKEGEK